MATDVVVAIRDKATDSLNILANTDEGRSYLASRGAGQRNHLGNLLVRSLELVQCLGGYQAG